MHISFSSFIWDQITGIDIFNVFNFESIYQFWIFSLISAGLIWHGCSWSFTDDLFDSESRSLELSSLILIKFQHMDVNSNNLTWSHLDNHLIIWLFSYNSEPFIFRSQNINWNFFRGELKLNGNFFNHILSIENDFPWSSL